MSNYIAVDIGGTHIRIALFGSHGVAPIQIMRAPTHHSGDAVIDQLVKGIQGLLPMGDNVAAVGIAAPGPTDQQAGIVYEAPNIPGWVDLPLRDILQDRLDLPVMLGNDGNLAAYGEWQFGAGMGHQNVIYITVSTGIGGGVISDGELILGHLGLAAELGHVTVDPDGPLCSCGKPGHLEAFASGTAISKFVAGELARGAESILSPERMPTAQEIHAAATRGDPLAIRAIDRAGRYLGIGVSGFLHVFNPSIVIFGGGVSMSGELLFGPMRETMSRYMMSPKFLQDLVITTAALGDDAGLLGALALARSNSEVI